MFSGLASLAQALQGGPDESEDEFEEAEQRKGKAATGSGDAGSGAEDEDEEQDSEEEGEEGQPGPGLSFWGVASMATALTANATKLTANATKLTAQLKAKTAEALTAVQETDWKAELAAFQQGAKDDADIIVVGADFVVSRAVEAAEQLPGTLEQLPDRAGAASNRLQRGAEAASAVAREQSRRGLAGLAGLGQKLVLGTSDLFDQVSNAIQNEMTLTDAAVRRGTQRRSPSAKALAGQARYSRFDADVAAMQRDSGTYCDEPEDEEEFEAWMAGFDLAARKPAVDGLIAENTFMSELQARIVPLIVEYNDFWTRYFYRLHKLEQKHEQFMQLTQRATQQEEEVGWSSDEEQEQQLSLSAAAAPLLPAQPAAAAPATAAEAAEAEGEVEAEEAPAANLGEVPLEAPEQEADLPPAAAVSSLPAEPAQIPAVAAAILSEPAGTEEREAGVLHVRTRSGSPSDDSNAATVSSDASLASGEHWQVVSSPRQGAAAVPATVSEQQQEEEEAAAAVMAGTSGENKAAAAARKGAPAAARKSAPAPAAAAAPAPAALAAAAAAATGPAAAADLAPAAAKDDDELSDWGEDDDAALEAAAGAAAAGAGGEGADAEESWGSDWE